MNAEQVRLMVAKRVGMTLEQNGDEIDDALNGAMEEISVHLTIPRAIADKSLLLAANASYVTWVEAYSQLLSVKYVYTPTGAVNQDTRILTNKQPAEADMLNAGWESQTNDELEFYWLKTGRIYIGPGIANVGGNIVVSWQRKLTAEDIPYLPDGMLAVSGTIANLLPMDHPQYDSYRRRFERGLAPAQVAAQPVREHHNQRRPNAQMLADDYYREGL